MAMFTSPSAATPIATSTPKLKPGKDILGLELRKLTISAVQGMCRGRKIRVVFRGTGAYTDGSTISLPAIRDLAIIPYETARAFIGYAIHEASHIRYTDFDQIKRAHTLGALIKAFENCIEDYRIERCSIHEYLGTASDLTKLRVMIHPANDVLPDEWFADPRASGPLALTWTGSQLNKFQNPHMAGSLRRFPIPVMKLIDNWTERMKDVQSTEEAVDLAIRFADEAIQYAKLTQQVADESDEQADDGAIGSQDDNDTNETPSDKNQPANDNASDPEAGNDRSKPDNSDEEATPSADTSDDADAPAGSPDANADAGADRSGDDAEESDDDANSNSDEIKSQNATDTDEQADTNSGEPDADGAQSNGDSHDQDDTSQSDDDNPAQTSQDTGDSSDGAFSDADQADDNETGPTEGSSADEMSDAQENNSEGGPGTASDLNDETGSTSQSSEHDPAKSEQPLPGQDPSLANSATDDADTDKSDASDGAKADGEHSNDNSAGEKPSDDQSAQQTSSNANDDTAEHDKAHDTDADAPTPAPKPDLGDETDNGATRNPFADMLEDDAELHDLIDDIREWINNGNAPLDGTQPDPSDGEVDPTSIIDEIEEINEQAPDYTSDVATDSDDMEPRGEADETPNAAASKHHYNDERFSPVAVEDVSSIQEYLDLKAQAAGSIATLARTVRRLLQSENKSGQVRNRRDGKFDIRNMNAIIQANGQCYKREWTKPANSTLLCVLTDFSGSMKGRPLQLAMTGALAIEQATQNTQINTCLYSYTGISPTVTLEIFKEGRQSKPLTRSKIGSYKSVSTLCTPTAEAMAAVATRMDKAQEQRKILLVLTDGAADDMNLCASVSRFLINRGIEVVAIGIGNYSVAQWAPVFHVINQVADLPAALLATIDPREAKKPRKMVA